MGASQTAQELIDSGKLYYGDPCYDSQFGDTHGKCKAKTPGGSLAHMVLIHYDIAIANDWAPGPNAECCPLDILNQDPFQCINMSLMSSLVNRQYWEVYADEYGKANFIKVLPESEIATLPRVQYCVPTLQPADIASLVIVRSADPPPFRKCGDKWYDILDGASTGDLRSWLQRGSIFPGAGAVNDARGVKFTWGSVTGMGPSQSTDTTCEKGKFDQFGTIIYPEYDRKQIYNDGITDFVEIQGFEQILFWLIDVDYNLSDDEMSHYAVQFVKSSDCPIHLNSINVGDTYNGHLQDFGPVCDLSESGQGTGTTPAFSLYPDPAAENAAKDATCSDVQSSIKEAEKRKKYILEWQEYSTPAFFGYGWTTSSINFNEASKWGVGMDQCTDSPLDNIYESTSSVWGNGCAMDHWSYTTVLDTTVVNFGSQISGRRTMDLSNGTVWVESLPKPADSGRLIYSLRAEAPSKASVKWGSNPWTNPFTNYMFTYIGKQFAGNTASLFGTSYKYPGYLFGWDDGLYLIDELWAKIKIARPGIAVQGFGRSVERFLGSVSLRVKPVYQIDFPVAIGAKGDSYDGWVDAYKDLANANQAYCKPLPEGLSEMEKLQEAQTGNTIDITIPFLFPDFKAAGQNDPNSVKSKAAFNDLSQTCYHIASFLWSYIEKYRTEGARGYTYVCGPPRSQSEVPKLGQAVETAGVKRTINSIAYSYNDGSAFTLTIETGPVQISQAHSGAITNKKVKGPIEVKGKIVDQGMGALYKVHIGSLGVITAWNIDKFPWDIGDKVNVTLYNHPAEI